MVLPATATPSLALGSRISVGFAPGPCLARVSVSLPRTGCLFSCRCYICASCKLRLDADAKYQIVESPILQICAPLCCNACSFCQVINTVTVKESKKWGFCGPE